jgi:hypothetical protein
MRRVVINILIILISISIIKGINRSEYFVNIGGWPMVPETNDLKQIYPINSRFYNGALFKLSSNKFSTSVSNILSRSDAPKYNYLVVNYVFQIFSMTGNYGQIDLKQTTGNKEVQRNKSQMDSMDDDYNNKFDLRKKSKLFWGTIFLEADSPIKNYNLDLKYTPADESQEFFFIKEFQVYASTCHPSCLDCDENTFICNSCSKGMISLSTTERSCQCKNTNDYKYFFMFYQESVSPQEINTNTFPSSSVEVKPEAKSDPSVSSSSNTGLAATSALYIKPINYQQMKILGCTSTFPDTNCSSVDNKTNIFSFCSICKSGFLRIISFLNIFSPLMDNQSCVCPSGSIYENIQITDQKIKIAAPASDSSTVSSALAYSPGYDPNVNYYSKLIGCKPDFNRCSSNSAFINQDELKSFIENPDNISSFVHGQIDDTIDEKIYKVETYANYNPNLTERLGIRLTLAAKSGNSAGLKDISNTLFKFEWDMGPGLVIYDKDLSNYDCQIVESIDSSCKIQFYKCNIRVQLIDYCQNKTFYSFNFIVNIRGGKVQDPSKFKGIKFEALEYYDCSWNKECSLNLNYSTQSKICNSEFDCTSDTSQKIFNSNDRLWVSPKLLSTQCGSEL